MTERPFARSQRARLSSLLGAVSRGNEFYQRKLREAGVDVTRLQGALMKGGKPVETLQAVPFTTKSELLDDQQAHPPFGTDLTYPREEYVRFNRTSGTVGHAMIWLDTRESWDWVLGCWDQIYEGAGVLSSDRAFFPFSFGPFLGFWSAFEGALRRGTLCIPGGGMSTLARLQILRDLEITVVAATPTYVLHMAEVARKEGFDLAGTAVRALIVAGEPGGSVPSVREKIESAWAARCFDHCGLTEVGPVGYECVENPGGMHVLEDDYIVEVVEPDSDSPAAEGKRGELVLTNLGRLGSPVIRYRTGDLVQWSRAPCPCGSPCGRLEGGILGRIDEMVFVRGNNVYPSAVESILRAVPGVGEFRIRLRQEDAMTKLAIEVEPADAFTGTSIGGGTGAPDIARRASAAVRAKLLFHVDVVVVPHGTLPRFEHKARRWIREPG